MRFCRTASLNDCCRIYPTFCWSGVPIWNQKVVEKRREPSIDSRLMCSPSRCWNSGVSETSLLSAPPSFVFCSCCSGFSLLFFDSFSNRLTKETLFLSCPETVFTKLQRQSDKRTNTLNASSEPWHRRSHGEHP